MKENEQWLIKGVRVGRLLALALGILLGALAEQNGLLPSASPVAPSGSSSKLLDCPPVQQQPR